jgi:hypothetical protein
VVTAAGNFSSELSSYSGDTTSYDFQPFQWPDAPPDLPGPDETAATPPVQAPTFTGPQFDPTQDPAYSSTITADQAAYDGSRAVKKLKRARKSQKTAVARRLNGRKYVGAKVARRTEDGVFGGPARGIGAESEVVIRACRLTAAKAPSGGTPVIVVQESAEPLAALDLAGRAADFGA